MHWKKAEIAPSAPHVTRVSDTFIGGAAPWAGMVALLFVFLLLFLLGSVAQAGEEPPLPAPLDTVSLPPEARTLASVQELLGDAPGTAKIEGLDPSLARLADALEQASAPGDQDRARLAQAAGVRLVGERAQVQLVIDPAQRAQVTQAVVALGGEITGATLDGTRLQGWLPLPALRALAQRPDVRYVSRPPQLTLLELDGALLASGTYTTEALDDTGVITWHQAGFRGQGVKIGIIDGGFQGYRGLLGSELPAKVTVKNFVDGETDDQVDGATAHGAACAEIIHDIAPDAQLYLAKIATDVDLQEAMIWMRDVAKVDVISTSIGWYNLSPGDGTGFFADVVAQARAAGILWVTAAGNDRESHWSGPFLDPDGNKFLNFTPTTEINFFGPGDGSTAYLIPSGVPVSVYLRWNDWTVTDQDYDLYLLRWDSSQSKWQTVAGSEFTQNGGAGQTPTEVIRTLTTGAPAPYGIAVAKYTADPINRPVNFDIYVPKFYRMDQILTSRSLVNLADAPDAMTVAALDVNAPYPQESYSSEGPTNGSGGSATGGFIKPDIAAYANVSTDSYGTVNKFNGTSSATPHVTGAAALVLSAYPSYTPAQVQAFLEGRAVDQGPAGMDNLTGYGRLYLGAPRANLASSSMAAASTSVAVGELVTYTIQMVNQGGVATTAWLTNELPSELLVTAQPLALGGVRPLTPTAVLTWTGPISPTSSVTILYTATLTTTNPSAPLRVMNLAQVRDGDGRTYNISAPLNPLELFLPLVSRD